MKWEAENMEDLIGKYIVGEATETEIRDLMEWCALSPENQKYLDDAVFIYEHAQLPDDREYSTDLAWDKVKGKIQSDTKTRFFLPIWGIAASLILFLGFSYLFYNQYFTAEEFKFSSENQVQTQVLPDSTEISLNQNSRAEVEYNERRNTGTIRVYGEVLISIPESKKVEWIVQTGNLLIQDIGTIFHVKALPDDETVEVSVQEGIVKFYTEGQDGIILKAGEKGTFDKASNSFAKGEADPNVAAYKTRAFSFQEQELQTVIDQLSQVYGKTILLEGDIASCKLTVDFVNEDLETILTIIEETMDLTVSMDSTSILISGEGCY